jgi:hypothetical protein
MSHSKIRVERHLALAVGVAAASASVANAAVVNRTLNLSIPATNNGLYINIETGASGTTASSTVGWDINPFGATALSFQSPLTNPVSGMMRAPGATTGVAGSLSGGTIVGSSGSFTSSVSPVTFGNAAGGWRLNADNYFGFKFVAAAGTQHYAYGIMRIGASATSRTLVSVHYESVAGAQITVVPTPGAAVLLAVAGFASRRRRS